MLSCNVREDFLVEASFEKDDTTNVSCAKRMQLKLMRLHDGQEVFIGSKSFPWPEIKMPKQMQYVPEGDFVEIRGASNIAKVPLKLKDQVVESVGKQANREPPVCIPTWNAHGKPEKGLISPLLAPIHDMLKSNKDPWLGQWNALEAALVNCPVVSPPLCLNAADQKKLLAFLLSKPDHVRLLADLIKRKVFGLPVADDLVKQLVATKNINVLQEFVSQCLNFPESANAQVLKFCASQPEKASDGLLKTVLRKPYTRELLVDVMQKTETGLDTNSAVVLINRLLPVVSTGGDSELVDKAIELISVLVDSFSTQIILDEKYHETIVKAVDITSGMTAVLDSYAQLQNRLKCNNSMVDSANLDGDYVILSVVLTSLDNQ
uniref:Uncharacterized protein n=1 Tax=Plectus sambesii TaxID=2011161 RepID=A0A914X612_9BILA